MFDAVCFLASPSFASYLSKTLSLSRKDSLLSSGFLFSPRRRSLKPTPALASTIPSLYHHHRLQTPTLSTAFPRPPLPISLSSIRRRLLNIVPYLSTFHYAGHYQYHGRPVVLDSPGPLRHAAALAHDSFRITDHDAFIFSRHRPRVQRHQTSFATALNGSRWRRCRAD